MLKVANIIEEARFGGPQNRIIRVASELKKLDVETCVIAPRNNCSRFKDKLIEHDIKHNLIPMSKLKRSSVGIIWFLVSFPVDCWRIFRLVRSQNPDVIHLSGGSWQWKGLVAAVFAGKPVIWHLNDTQMPAVIHWVFNLLSGFADSFIYAGQSVKDYYSSSVRGSVRPSKIIPAPVSTKIFRRQQEFSTGQNHRKQNFTVGMVANYNPTKGLDLFLDIASLLSELNIEFVSVGHISNRYYYDHLIKRICRENLENVKLLGPTDDTVGFYNSVDVILCTSLHEASPTVVWEALSTETPVLSRNVGDVAQFADLNKAVTICDTVNEFVRELCELFNNEGIIESRGVSGREIAVANFDIAVVSKLHKKLYLELVE